MEAQNKRRVVARSVLVATAALLVIGTVASLVVISVIFADYAQWPAPGVTGPLGLVVMILAVVGFLSLIRWSVDNA